MIGEVHQLIVDGRPFVMLAGEVHNSTGSSLVAMEGAWDKARRLHLNSLLVPVSWELIEPREGEFDFTLVDGIVAQARKYGMHLGLLWFGSWKNAMGMYAPEWVKRDLDRFPRAEVRPGEHKVILDEFHKLPYSTFSMFGEETCEADARAFSALMAHVASIDVRQRTVLAVQVENECGLMGAAREHSIVADEAFSRAVPKGLIAAVEKSEELAPDVAAALAAGQDAGTWHEVFGEVAEEIFSAYHIARYVERVAHSGAVSYAAAARDMGADVCKSPVLFVNCWLDKGHRPGRFPSGGSVARVMEVWRFAAPSIDFVAPDIYVPTFCETCDQYRKLGNPLFIAEAAYHAYAAPRQVFAVGEHRALCYAPFGIEGLGEPFDAQAGVLFGAASNDPALALPQDPDEYAKVTAALRGLLGHMGRLSYACPTRAAISEGGLRSLLTFGDIGIEVSFDGGGLPGACMVAQEGPEDYWLVAMRCAIEPRSLDKARPHVDLLALEDGVFDADGQWVRARRLNGDEATIMRFDEPVLLRLRLFSYR